MYDTKWAININDPSSWENIYTDDDEIEKEDLFNKLDTITELLQNNKVIDDIEMIYNSLEFVEATKNNHAPLYKGL